MAKKIIAIDDSRTALQLIEESLTAKGYTVEVFTKIKDFVFTAFDDSSVGLILMDIEMPQLNGNTLCRRLKDDPRTKDIPVILLSSLPKDTIKALANQCGADAFLTKASFSDDRVFKVLEPFLARNGVFPRQKAALIDALEDRLKD